MLPSTYRFQAFNGFSSGDDLTPSGVKVTAIRWLFDSSAALVYESSEATLYRNVGTVPSGTYDNSSGISNTTDKYLGGHFEFSVTPSGAPVGSTDLYFQRSTDGGSVFDSDGLGLPVASIYFD